MFLYFNELLTLNEQWGICAKAFGQHPGTPVIAKKDLSYMLKNNIPSGPAKEIIS